MKQTKLFEERYNRVMTKVAKSVRTILERLDEEELAECFEDDAIEECGDMFDCESSDMNEMARKTRRSTIPKNIENVMRDAIMRRDWDEQFAITTKPLAKWTHEQLLQRYVFGLILLKKACPKTVEEIDDIAVYANYAHKFLEQGGTLEEIQELYAEQDPISEGKRTGAKRSVKAYRKSAEDFDFDKKEDAVEVNDVEELEDVVDVEDADADTVDVDVEELDDVEDLDINDYPDYDDVDIEDVDDTEELEEVEPVVSEESDEIVIKNIDEVTYDGFMDPKMNNAFAEFNDKLIVVNKDGSVSVQVDIVDSESKQKESYVVTGASFGEVLSKIHAMIWASYDASDCFYEIRTEKVINWLMKAFMNTVEDDTEINNMGDEVLETCFDGVKNVKDVVERLKKHFK